jgi:uncharacterized protein
MKQDAQQPKYKSDVITLILPGWQNSGSAHWQSRWEVLHGCVRVSQHDWLNPQRGDWIVQLEEAVIGANAPVRLVAHSLGCHLVAAWAAISANTGNIRGALLVAPPAINRPDMPPNLHSWRVPALARLPFPSLLAASTNDPFGSLAEAQVLADAWGSTLVNLGALGHINAESGLGDWPRGWSLLEAVAA